jgi:3-oxoacyl-[acyl-carrier protein] reductase
MNLELGGKAALVTGGSRGIGKAIAEALLREGAAVAICARNADALAQAVATLETIGPPVLGKVADVTDAGAVSALVDAARSAFGRIDILVNNAGILRIAPLENISEERWDETLAVHLKGTFNCTQAVIPFMKQQRKGKIINLAAPSALRGSYGVADYAAAKGGIVAFTRNAANELKAYNIQVNCISPTADTRMTEALTKFRREQLGIPRREREFISPDAIAPAFVFFASSDSDYVSGQLLEVGRV